MVRETREETGIAVRCGEMVGWAERIDEGYHFVILDFWATADAVREPVAGSDATAARWQPLASLQSVQLVAGLRTFLRDHGVA